MAEGFVHTQGQIGDITGQIGVITNKHGQLVDTVTGIATTQKVHGRRLQAQDEKLETIEGVQNQHGRRIGGLEQHMEGKVRACCGCSVFCFFVWPVERSVLLCCIAMRIPHIFCDFIQVDRAELDSMKKEIVTTAKKMVQEGLSRERRDATVDIARPLFEDGDKDQQEEHKPSRKKPRLSAAFVAEANRCFDDILEVADEVTPGEGSLEKEVNGTSPYWPGCWLGLRR